MEPTLIPHNPEPGAEERNWATFCHLAAFAGLIIPFIGNVAGPTILWLLKRDEFPLVREQGKEALNFQITISVTAIFCAMLFFLLIGHLLLGILFVFNAVSIIIAALNVSKGEHYRYPFSLRLIN